MNGRQLKILIIDDSADDAVLMVYELAKAGYDVTHTLADTESEVRKLLAECSWDCITSDHKMPRFSAPEAVRVVREIAPDMPLVIVSGELDIDLAVNLLKSGADDYVQKRDLPLVVKAVESAIERSHVRVREKLEKERSEERLRLLESYFDLPFIGVAILTCEQTTIEANNTLCGMIGWSQEKLIGNNLSSVVYHEDQDQYRDNIERLCEGSTESFEAELRMAGSAGAPIPVKLIARTITIEEDGRRYLLMLVLDQTKQVELATLAESRGNMLAAMSKTSPFAVYLFNVKTLGFTYASPQAQEMFGLNEQEMIELGKDIWKLRAHPDDLNEFDHYQEHITQVTDEETVSSHFRLIHKDRTYHRYICHETVYKRDANGEPEIVFGIQSDITALMQLECRLKDINLRLDRIVGATGIGVINVNAEGAVIDANSVICRILGFDRDELKVKNIVDVVGNAEIRDLVVNRSQAQNGKHDLCRFELVCQDGSKYMANSSVHYIDTSTGPECIIVVHDCHAH